jgi:hypothetical protein
LQEGEALTGEADQHGVDLVIDVYGPDGKPIRTLDGPNGSEGSEPIELTAFEPGRYDLVVHTLDAAAKPGRSVTKINRVLTAEENGRRLAEKDYPPALQGLWRSYPVGRSPDPGSERDHPGLVRGSRQDRPAQPRGVRRPLRPGDAFRTSAARRRRKRLGPARER